MRNILLCLVGALAVTGCAAHESSWRVRDQHGWPVQTWDAVPLVVATNPQRCLRPGVTPGPIMWGARRADCCEITDSLNSWGEHAARCGGRHHVSTVTHRAGDKDVTETGYFKPTSAPVAMPVAMPPPRPTPVQAPMHTASMRR